MERKNWTCNACNAVKVKSVAGRYMVCPDCNGRMTTIWAIKDLPLALRIDYKRFKVGDLGGVWEYVPHTHTGCMERAPESGHVVARVEYGVPYEYSRHRARTFRPCKPPGRRK